MDLSDFFVTKSQANDFTLRLNAIIDRMYTTNFNLDQALTQQFGVHKKDVFTKLLRENNMTNASMTAIQEFLKKIQETISTLPVVTLTLAFEPSEDTLSSFSQWFLFNLKKQVVFEIEIDTHLIAGAKITYNGKFKDYSLGPLFEKMVKDMLYPTNQPPAQKVQQSIPVPTHQDAQNITSGK